MKHYLIVCLTVALLLTGCANTIARMKGADAELNYADYAGEPINSFAMTTFDGWTVVGDKEVVIRTAVNNAYLIKVVGYCPNLKFTPTIGVTSSAGQVDRFEKVIVGRDRCMISEIRPIDMVRMQADHKAKIHSKNAG